MSGASGRVLVVDDNKVIRQLIRVNLELEGFEVVTAADGAECLDVVHQVRPDLITLDVVMPRLDGLSAAAQLRGDPRTRRLPLAIISACNQYEVEAGLDVGVDAFLAKPFEPSELVALVRQLVERAHGGGGEAVPDGAGVDSPVATATNTASGTAVTNVPAASGPAVASPSAGVPAGGIGNASEHPERAERAGRA
ncbi:response regulator [Streptomyces sp. DSM 3412]|uniref:Response regulator n=1 Tax=Streptomyces gottesmaniae TaxID=3075518 RepID=A0ABU2Z6V0_9ACTN|nr:response regulator [Streptomyces sp. DSM 3412]MDT0572315.1 response regulator [Streptomyces sp. DSM 3412]